MKSPVYRYFLKYSLSSIKCCVITLIVFGLVSFYLLQFPYQIVDQSSKTVYGPTANTNTPSYIHFSSVIHHLVESTGSQSDIFKMDTTSKESDYSKKNETITKPTTSINIHSESIKRILWYVPPNYILSTEKGKLRPLKACPDLPCEETTDRDLLSQADAVIFDVDKTTHLKTLPLKHLNQVWVLYANESPIYIQENLNSRMWRSVFNWTCSYRRDSDIWMPYGLFEKRAPPVKDYDKIVKRKSKMASWLVSHCDSQSKRREYVHLLEKNGIETDIFGGCGKMKCPRTQEGQEECRNISTGEYSFYFSFENSLCKDYVTEKLFDYFNEDIILVVRGGRGNYRQYPPGIFINTEDFKNVGELASYMKELHNNKTKYVEFLKRKDAYRAVEETFTFKSTKGFVWTTYYYFSEPMCDMCRKLLKRESKPQVYKDIHAWVNDDFCYPPTDLK